MVNAIVLLAPSGYLRFWVPNILYSRKVSEEQYNYEGSRAYSVFFKRSCDRSPLSIDNDDNV